jgi:hypothetical protein
VFLFVPGDVPDNVQSNTSTGARNENRRPLLRFVGQVGAAEWSAHERSTVRRGEVERSGVRRSGVQCAEVR